MTSRNGFQKMPAPGDASDSLGLAALAESRTIA